MAIRQYEILDEAFDVDFWGGVGWGGFKEG